MEVNEGSGGLAGKGNDSPGDEHTLRKALRELLGRVDLNITTERMLRKELEQTMGIELKDRKEFIRGEIREFLSLDEGERDSVRDDQVDQGSQRETPVARSKRKSRFGHLLSVEMSEFLGMEECARGQVVKKLWEYIKAHKLQDPKNGRRIILDDKLKILFPGRKFMTMFNMNKLLNSHVYIDDSLHGTQSAKKQSRAAKPEPKEKQTSKQANKDEKTNNGPKLTGFTKPLNLSPELQAWMGVSSCSRPEIVKKFWSYIRQNNLQDPNDKRYVNADDTLIHLTGETRFQAFSFAKLVKKHIYGYVD